MRLERSRREMGVGGGMRDPDEKGWGGRGA